MTDTDDIVLPVPANAPRVKPSRFARWLGRGILKLGGWRMVGALPDIPRLVLIGAPHSSNWDGVWGFAAKLALGVDIRVLGKDSLFRIPVLGYLLRHLGVMPVDRRAARGVIEQAAALIRGSDRFWYGLAPEGTRKRVERWKTGFWKIAKAADVELAGSELAETGSLIERNRRTVMSVHAEQQTLGENGSGMRDRSRNKPFSDAAALELAQQIDSLQLHVARRVG